MDTTDQKLSYLKRRIQGFAPPKLSRELLRLLTSVSRYTPDGYDQLQSTIVITCDPVTWFFASAISPIEYLNVGKVFGWPDMDDGFEHERAVFDDQDPDADEMFGLFENIVHECVTISDAIDYIAAGKPSFTTEELKAFAATEELKEFAKQISLNPQSRNWVESVVLDYSLPFGGRGGVFEQLLSNMPEHLSRISALQGHISLMMCSLIVKKCPNIRELIALMPSGSLFQEPLEPCRDFLRSHMDLAAIVELPSGALQPSTNIPSAVVVFQKKTDRSQTLFYHLQGTGDLIGVETQPWLLDLKSSLLGELPRYGFFAEVKPNSAWTSQCHLPKTYRVSKGLVEFCKLVRLADLFEVIAGIRFPREIAGSKGGDPVIRGRDIGKGSLKENLERFVFKMAAPERARAKKWDLLIQKIGANPAVTMVGEDLEGSIVGDTVFILRPRSDSVPVDAIYQTLSSGEGQRLLASASKGAFAPTISIKTLEGLDIPILPEEISRKLGSSAKAEDGIRQRADRLTSIRHSIFVAESREEFERKLISLETETEVFTSSLAASDDINYRIRNFYPFPLAFSYRLLGSIVDPAELYREQLRMGENILAFLGSVTLALTESHRSVTDIDLKAIWRGGISPGHWLDVARKCANLLTEKKSGELAVALQSLWKERKRESRFCINLRELIETKNKFKHDKGARTNADFASGSIRLSEQIKECMASLEFILRFPIRLVCDINIDRRSGMAILDTLNYAGDHPGLRQEKVKRTSPWPKDTLSIEIKDGKWETLFPFITVQNCPRCQTREIYFVDKWQGDKADVKSFERGHIETSPEVAQELLELTRAIG